MLNILPLVIFMTFFLTQTLAAMQALEKAIAITADTIWYTVLSFFRWPHAALAFFAFFGFSAVVYLTFAYLRWRRGWVSVLIEKKLGELGFIGPWQRIRKLVLRRIDLFALARTIPHRFFSAIHACVEYLRAGMWSALADYYIPSLTTAVVVLLVIAIVVFVPDPPRHAGLLLSPISAFHQLIAKLDDKSGLEAPEKILEGLIAIVIALIFFVAESIRSGKSSDEKRVLLKLSNLWLLGLLITTIPLVYLYPPGTGLAVIAILSVAALTLFTFGRVLINLLSPDAIANAQRTFLRQRIRKVVIDSAKQRIGNRILSDRLGADKDIRMNLTLSKSWLPGTPSKYEFIEAGEAGLLVDVNLDELKRIMSSVNLREEALTPVTAPSTDPSVTGPRTRRAPRAANSRPESSTYLLRRFGEETPRGDNIFASDTSVIAIRKSVARRDGLLDEVRTRSRRAFKYSDKEPPSNAFRLEMKVTKDRLLAAIAVGALGEIDELRQTYLVVAEEFLIALNDLGGGYSAEQARSERNAFFEGWTEVRWLRDDIRDLIEAAARTDITDVIGRMAFLPFAIATRAFLAGDQLLFQEFLTFGSYIYSLGRAKPVGSKSGEYLIERSWRYLKEILHFYVESALSEEYPDDD